MSRWLYSTTGVFWKSDNVTGVNVIETSAGQWQVRITIGGTQAFITEAYATEEAALNAAFLLMDTPQPPNPQ